VAPSHSPSDRLANCAVRFQSVSTPARPEPQVAAPSAANELARQLEYVTTELTSMLDEFRDGARNPPGSPCRGLSATSADRNFRR
jgi:hypothetical protein